MKNIEAVDFPRWWAISVIQYLSLIGRETGFEAWLIFPVKKINCWDTRPCLWKVWLSFLFLKNPSLFFTGKKWSLRVLTAMGQDYSWRGGASESPAERKAEMKIQGISLQWTLILRHDHMISVLNLESEKSPWREDSRGGTPCLIEIISFHFSPSPSQRRGTVG